MTVPLMLRGTLDAGPRTQGAMAADTRPVGRVPRVAKLMALAIRFDGLVRSGVVRDYSELARLGHVTRARMTQVMNLLHLAPEIQEALLFLPPVEKGRDPIILRELQPLARESEWRTQRRLWRQLPQTAARG
jgi:hypothetical protein